MILYELRLQGHLDPQWSDWLEGLNISHEEDGTTLLRGPLPDEAALYGVLMKIRNLASPLISVQRVAADAETLDGAEQ